MVKIEEIKQNLRTDFSKILNQYDRYLEISKNATSVLDKTKIRADVETIIQLISEKNVKRIPYDSITTSIIDFNIKSNEDEGLAESFDFLMTQTHEVMINIINDLSKNKFQGRELNNSEKNKYEIATIAFYKLFEHTKLATSQYQNLYQKTENEVNKLNISLNEKKNEINVLKNDISKSKEDISKAKNEIEEFKKSIYTDFIAILGVFSAFVFVMFGGFSALSDIIASLSQKNVSVGKTLLVSSFLFGFLITVLYSLLYWVSLIIEKPICYNSCDCNKPCGKFTHSLKRHGYFLIFIVCCIIMIIFSAFFAK